MSADQSPLHPRTSTDQLRTILTARLPDDPKWVAWIDGVVGELAGCVVEDPRLAQIRALCDDSDETGGGLRGWILADRVRAVLGALPVPATPPQGIDRAALWREVAGISNDYQTAKALSGGMATDLLDDMAHRCMAYLKTLLDQEQEGLALVRPVPPQTIDRDALIARLQSINWGNSATRIDRDRFWGECADAVLAVVRPVEGATLTPDVRAAFETADSVLRHHGFTPTADVLASWLEASS